MASTTFDSLSLAFLSDLKTLEDNIGHKIERQGQKLAGEIKDAVDNCSWRFFAALAPIYLASLAGLLKILTG